MSVCKITIFKIPGKLCPFDSKFFVVEFKRLLIDLKSLTSSLLGALQDGNSDNNTVIQSRLQQWKGKLKKPIKWLKVLLLKKSPMVIDNTTYYEIKELLNTIEIELPLIKDLDVGKKFNKRVLLKLYKLLKDRLFFLHSIYNIFARNSKIPELDEIHLVDFSNRDKLKRVK